MQKVKKYKQTITKNNPKKNNEKSKNKNETDITMANPWKTNDIILSHSYLLFSWNLNAFSRQ